MRNSNFKPRSKKGFSNGNFDREREGKRPASGQYDKFGERPGRAAGNAGRPDVRWKKPEEKDDAGRKSGSLEGKAPKEFRKPGGLEGKGQKDFRKPGGVEGKGQKDFRKPSGLEGKGQKEFRKPGILEEKVQKDFKKPGGLEGKVQKDFRKSLAGRAERELGGGSPRREETRHSEPWRPEDGVLVWGTHVVETMIDRSPDRVRLVYLDRDGDDERNAGIASRAASLGIKVVALAELGESALAGEVHQGIAAKVMLPQPLVIDDLLERIEKAATPPLILALDSIQDPHNFGSIVRSAVAAGVIAIIMPKDRSVRVTGTVFKVSAGALALIDICPVTNLVQSLRQLKEKGVWVYGTAAEAAVSIYQTDWRGAACLVVGNEHKGLRELVRRECDGLASIPMAGGFDSLNAGVATAVVLFEMVRQRSIPA